MFGLKMVINSVVDLKFSRFDHDFAFKLLQIQMLINVVPYQTNDLKAKFGAMSVLNRIYRLILKANTTSQLMRAVATIMNGTKEKHAKE